MSELDKAKDVSKLGQVSSVDKTEASGDDLKLSQKIDFTKYPNLERISSEDLEALVTDKDGKVLSEEGLVAANKVAGEKNTDGIQKSDDEDIKAMQDMGNYYLAMKGKFGGHESLHEAIHDKDGNLKSEKELKELDAKVKVDADAAIKKSDEEKKHEAAHSSLTAADEKNKGIDEETEAVNKEFEEVLGEDAFKEMQDKAKEEKEASRQKENNADADLSTEEGRNEFIKNVSQVNETLDKPIDLDNDKGEDIAVKYFRTDEKENALEQSKDALEKAKAAKAEQEKAQKQTESTQGASTAQQSADPDAAAKDAEKLKEYTKSDSAKNAKSGQLYADNTAFVKQTIQEDKQNDAVNANNDKFFNKQQDENLKALYEKQAGLVFERGEGNKNDLSTLLAGAEDGKKLTKDDIQEKIKASQEKNADSSVGKPGEEKEFDPYNATEDSGDATDVAGLDKSSESAGSSSQLQFDKSSAGETDEVTGDIDEQMAEEKDAFDARREKEKGRADGIEKDIKTQDEMQELLFSKVQPTDEAAKKDTDAYAAVQGAVNSAKSVAAKNITNIQEKTKQNQQAQAQNTTTNANNESQKNNEAAVDFAAAAAAAAVPGGQGAAAMWIGLATAAIKAAMQFGAEKNKSNAYEDTLRQQQAAAEQTKQALAAEQTKIDTANQKEYNEVTKPLGMAILDQTTRQAQALINASRAQTKQIDKIETAKDTRLNKLAADKEKISAKKQAATENKEVKETKEDAVANAGDKVGQDKKAESNQEKVFEFKENEDVKQDDMKEQFANPLMADKKEAKDAKESPQSVLANAGVPKIGVDTAVAEKEDAEEDKDGIANVQFEAYSKENKITKEVLGVEDDGMAKVDTSEKQPKKPALRMASRFAKTAEKVNGVDGTAAKGFTA